VLIGRATLQRRTRHGGATRPSIPIGVLVRFSSTASPATHYGLDAGRRINRRAGQPTPDSTLSSRGERQPIRASLSLKTSRWNGQTDVITLTKLDKHYWTARRAQIGQEEAPGSELRSIARS